MSWRREPSNGVLTSWMSEESDPRLYHAHVARNREPILEVLRRVLPPRGLVLEVASGSGEHAAYFAKRLPTLLWQPTDPDPRALASIAAHRTAADTPNLLSPLWLDAMSEEWPVQRVDALVCINMIHITPWAACKGLMTGAERILRSGGALYLCGPYQIDGRHTAQSNEDFDAWLRTQNPQWGVRDLAEVTELAAGRGFSLRKTIPMPANNLSVIFERGP
jgi:SAM-dependent methyltransferase